MPQLIERTNFERLQLLFPFPSLCPMNRGCFSPRNFELLEVNITGLGISYFYYSLLLSVFFGNMNFFMILTCLTFCPCFVLLICSWGLLSITPSVHCGRETAFLLSLSTLRRLNA